MFTEGSRDWPRYELSPCHIFKHLQGGSTSLKPSLAALLLMEHTPGVKSQHPTEAFQQSKLTQCVLEMMTELEMKLRPSFMLT